MSALQPRESSRAATSARVWRPISTTTVAAPGASEPRTGVKAVSAWPETTTKAVESPRWVTGMPASPGAATAVETPGTTSQGIPAAASARASSPPRPKTNGSPLLSRTTRSPRSARRIISRSMVACEMEGRPARLPT